MSARDATSPTLGSDLERQRLAVRAIRLDRVLDVLTRRAAAAGAGAVERAGLRRAIDDFAAERAEVQARLRGTWPD